MSSDRNGCYIVTLQVTPECPEILAEIAVDIHALNLGLYHYRVPIHLKEKIGIGNRVKISFGSRSAEGYVVGFTPITSIKNPPEEFKDIQEVLNPDIMITPGLLELARHTSRTYVAPFASVLRCIIPSAILESRAKKIRIVRLVSSSYTLQKDDIIQMRNRAPSQARILSVLLETPSKAMDLKTLLKITGSSKPSVDSLVKKGLIIEEKLPWHRDPYEGVSFPEYPPFNLTKDQAFALQSIQGPINAAKKDIFLLFGVTASGKTEVYLQAISKAVSAGKQALVLVPEIALTPQAVERFRGRFGRTVAVIHSGLSSGARHDEWKRISNGEAMVAIGVRSAIFSPFLNLGLIVVDEEHETSYKQEDVPRYNARDLAILRGSIETIPVVLGSATPSVESYYRALSGEYRLLALPGRIDEKPLPEAHIVDMRSELQKGNKSIFSTRLLDGIKKRLAHGEQAVLFLNRRGFSTFVLCRECGQALRCPHCDVSLTFHYGAKRVICHYCGHSIPVPDKCPNCGGTRIRFFGSGTEKVEDEVKRLFPEARTLRLDRDSVSKRGAVDRIYRAFREGQADILVGTQMVAKGLDVPGVTLVGVISADTCLNLPDFRAAERTFSLITQVAGRAGRGDCPGEVIIQSYDPNHYSIQMAATQDYESFFKHEIALRKHGNYPPFSSMIFLECHGPLFAKSHRWRHEFGIQVVC